MATNLKDYHEAVEAYKLASTELTNTLKERCDKLSSKLKIALNTVADALAEEPAGYNQKAEHKDKIDATIQELDNWKIEIGNSSHRVEATSKALESVWGDTVARALSEVPLQQDNSASEAENVKLDTDMALTQTPNDPLPGISNGSLDSPDSPQPSPSIDLTNASVEPNEQEVKFLDFGEKAENKDENSDKRSGNVTTKAKSAKPPK